jgi:8-oxo-(d)GTP phosphatase
VLAVIDDLMHGGEDAVLCTHRPVLPTVYDCLGVEPVPQATGELVVIHHRRARVRAIEHHLV